MTYARIENADLPPEWGQRAMEAETPRAWLAGNLRSVLMRGNRGVILPA
jgi:hypothetical protein